MIISQGLKCVFIKTRKTAGSTLEHLMYPFLDQEKDMCTGSPRDNTPRLNSKFDNGHTEWTYVYSQHPIAWRDYFKFTIERNPWDKVVSSYFWHQKIKPEQFGEMDFEEYVLTCGLLPRDWHLYSRANDVMVDEVFKYEEMDYMYEALNYRLGIDMSGWDTTKMKAGIRKVQDYREMHTPKTIDAVANMFHHEIKLLGYEY